MALLSPCVGCGKEVCHSASEMPMCDKCSGKEAALEAEAKRWAALTADEKLDELKAKVDDLMSRSSGFDWNRPIG